ncbi:MAG: hypothetical protein Q9207_007778 [Kuettlingeria erythrocarpa]
MMMIAAISTRMPLVIGSVNPGPFGEGGYDGRLTPDIEPELFEPCPTETINTQHDCGGTGKRYGPNQAVGASPVTEVKAKGPYRETRDKDSFSCSGFDETARRKDQEPHSQAVTTQKAAQSFRHVGEDYRASTEYHPCHKSSHENIPVSIRKAPATARAGVIVGVIGSSSVPVCAVLLGRIKLLLPMAVAVSTAGSLEEVEEAFPSDVEAPNADDVALDLSSVVFGLDDAAADGVDV